MNEELEKGTAQTSDPDQSREPAAFDAVGGEENGAEFEEGSSPAAKEGEGKEEPSKKAVQSPEINAQNARRRREQERARELTKAREDAIIEALGGENPFTHEPMEDSSDVEEYLAMKKIEKEGGDPIADYRKHLKKEGKEKARKELEREQSEEWFKKDREDFLTKHPDTSLEELVADKHFADYAEGKIGKKPLSEIYEGYLAHKKDLQDTADKRAAQAAANKKASPGGLAGTSGGENDFFTREQVKAMSQSEVKKNYDKIRRSMSHWK